MKKNKDQQCGEQRLHSTGSHANDRRKCKERDNDANLNRMKCLYHPNRAAIRTRANAADEPRLIRVATSNNWHETKLTGRNGAGEVEASTDIEKLFGLGLATLWIDDD